MALLFTNNASGTLANTLNTGVLTAVLSSGEGALFPTPSGGDTFYATIEDAAGNYEVISCTARSGDNLTIVRAQEGTTDQTFTAGARVEIRLTAATLASLLQTSTAVTDYAPRTHFDFSGTEPRVLHNGNIAAVGTVQGVDTRRTSGQTTTSVGLHDSAGAAEASVASNSTNELIIENLQPAGNVIVRATNASSSPTDVIDGDPDGATDVKYAGATKMSSATHGQTIRGLNAIAPYDSHLGLYNSSGGTLLAAVGLVGSTNEIRLVSYSDGYPVGIYGTDTANGTLQPIIVGDPDGGVSGYYAGSRKHEATPTGMTVTGVVTQSTTPTAASHLTTKSYVDNADANPSWSTVSLGTSGYTTLPGGVTYQWGTVSFSTSTGVATDVAETFSTPFTTLYQIVGTLETNDAVGQQYNCDIYTANHTTSGFNARFHKRQLNGTFVYNWIAVGRI